MSRSHREGRGSAQSVVESNAGTWERCVYHILYIHFTHATLENIFAPALGDQRNSWLVLIRQACLFLLQSIADSPQCVMSYCIYDPSNPLFRSPNSLMHFQLLDILLSQDLAVSVIGPDGTNLCATIVEYLFNHRLYQLLRSAIQRMVSYLSSCDH